MPEKKRSSFKGLGVKVNFEFFWESDEDSDEFDQYLIERAEKCGMTPNEYAIHMAIMMIIFGKQGKIETGYHIDEEEETNGTL